MRSKGIIVVVLGLLILGSCGGSELLVTKAGAYTGGALSSFGGPDGQLTEARNVARDIATQREYEFIAPGFVLAAGPVTSAGLTSLEYTDGNGTLELAGNEATARLNITSNNPAVFDAQMVGTFDLADAQRAIDSPGASFVVEWELTFMLDGTPVSLTALQTLTGTNFQEV